MVISIDNIQLFDDFKAAVGELPAVEVQSVQYGGQASGASEPDIYLSLKVQGEPAELLAVTKKYGHPRDIRDAIWRLEEIKANITARTSSTPRVLMVIAPATSERGREILRKEGFGYWDQGGSLYIELPWALFFIDRPRPGAALRQIRKPYSGQNAQVLHALLAEPVRDWQILDLAERAQTSTATVHRVLTFLEQELWVEKRGKGPATVRTLRDPGALLDAWASNHSLDKYRFYRFYHWSKSRTPLRRQVTGTLNEMGIDYALTLDSGAELVAPFTTGVARLAILVQDEARIEQVAREMNLAPVESGENIAFLATRDYSPLMFRQQIDDIFVASNIQLYLDLRAWPKRGKEQAEHLRSERLPY